MNNELIQLATLNLTTFKAWVGINARLQKSADNIHPFIEAYETANNTKEVSGGSCQDCIIDLIRWVIKQVEGKEPTAKHEPKKK